MDIDELMRRLFKLYPEGYAYGFNPPLMLISTVMSYRPGMGSCSKEAL
jgi:endonuclease-3